MLYIDFKFVFKTLIFEFIKCKNTNTYQNKRIIRSLFKMLGFFSFFLIQQIYMTYTLYLWEHSFHRIKKYPLKSENLFRQNILVLFIFSFIQFSVSKCAVLCSITLGWKSYATWLNKVICISTYFLHIRALQTYIQIINCRKKTVQPRASALSCFTPHS